MLRNSLLKMVPLLLGAMAVLSIVLDEQSRYLRLAFFLPFLVGGLLVPRLSFWALIPAALWFHLKTVQWGYPNQFVFEFSVMAWLTAMAIRHRPSTRRITNKGSFQFFSRLIAHPFFLVMAFCVISGLLSFAIAYGELKAFSLLRLTPHAFVTTAARSLFAWQVTGPLHPLSLVTAYSIYLCLLARLAEDHGRLHITRWAFVDVVMLSALPVFAMAVGQYYLPSLFSRQFAVDVSGTFQNGNHLSFFAALVILFAAWRFAAAKRGDVVVRGFTLLIGLLSLFPLLVGRGRNAWIGLATASAISFVYFIWPRLTRIFRYVLSGVVATTLVVATVMLWRGSGFGGSSLRLLDAERAKQMLIGWDLFWRHPWQGIGFGNFFLYADLGFDIHNLYQGVLVELGIFGLLTTLVGIVLFAKAVFFSDSRLPFAFELRPQVAVSMAVAVMLLVTGVLDVFFTYRYFLFILLLWFALELLHLPDMTFVRVSYQFWLRRSFMVVSLLAAAVGLSGLFYAPQSRALLKGSYQIEKWDELGRNYRWHGPIAELAWNPANCLRFVVRPVSVPGLQVLTLSFLAPDTKVPDGMRIREYLRWHQSLSNKTTSALYSDTWNLVCACPSERLSREFAQRCAERRGACRLYLGLGDASYMSLTGDGKNRDDRLLAMAIDSQPEHLPYADIYAKPAFDKLHCAEVTTIP